jgi:predicted lipoprotein with Yx(FWY)xxD motif
MSYVRRGNSVAGLRRPLRQIKGWRWAAVTLVAAALPAAACGSSSPAKPATSATSSAPASSSSAPASSSSAPATSTSALKTTTIGGVAVVTNAKGFTLYWFVPDTSTKSNCNGSCTSYWPPVAGPATAGAGVTGKLGTIKRSDGSTQATYDGHPLYTYIGDTAPGQAKGNGLNLSGGVWHEMTVSGATTAASSTSSASGAGAY